MGVEVLGALDSVYASPLPHIHKYDTIEKKVVEKLESKHIEHVGRIFTVKYYFSEVLESKRTV